MNRLLSLVMLALTLVAGAFAQVGESADKVVEAARSSRNATQKSKAVLTDDAIRAGKTGIPDVSHTEDNTAEIVAAILKYYDTHTPSQTEEKAKEWYALQDSEMERMVVESSNIREEASDRCESADERDAAACERLQSHRARLDATRKNELRAAFWRMNATIQRVRFHLAYKKLKYDWMVQREYPQDDGE
jgi:hypothetical protein